MGYANGGELDEARASESSIRHGAETPMDVKQNERELIPENDGRDQSEAAGKPGLLKCMLLLRISQVDHSFVRPRQPIVVRGPRQPVKHTSRRSARPVATSLRFLMDFGGMPRRSDQFCRGRHPASIYDLRANSFMICRDWSINSGASAGRTRLPR